MTRLWPLIPLLAGALQPVIWGMNLRIDKETGPVEAGTLLHLVGAITGVLFWLGGMRGAGFGGLGAVPLWAWFGGSVGISCMVMVTRAMPVLGASTCFALLVAAQFSASLVFDHYGWLGLAVRPITLARVLGALLLAVGAWLVSRPG